MGKRGKPFFELKREVFLLGGGGDRNGGWECFWVAFDGYFTLVKGRLNNTYFRFGAVVF